MSRISKNFHLMFSGIEIKNNSQIVYSSELYIHKMYVMLTEFGLKPWEWDMDYCCDTDDESKEMYGQWYEEDLNSLFEYKVKMASVQMELQKNQEKEFERMRNKVM